MIDYEKTVAVTNRHLCFNDYLEQIRKIVGSGVKTIIVREKDLAPDEYLKLYERVLKVCEEENGEVLCIPHRYLQACREFGSKMLHLPFDLFCRFVSDNGVRGERELQVSLGTSVHSVEDALFAERAGASYIIAGHIFATACKKGAAPRGLDFLRSVCGVVNIPVYAIGGINQSNYGSALAAGAAKVCMMSEMMCI